MSYSDIENWKFCDQTVFLIYKKIYASELRTSFFKSAKKSIYLNNFTYTAIRKFVVHLNINQLWFSLANKAKPYANSTYLQLS